MSFEETFLPGMGPSKAEIREPERGPEKPFDLRNYRAPEKETVDPEDCVACQEFGQINCPRHGAKRKSY